MATKRDTRTREHLLAEIEFLKRGGWAAQAGPIARYVVVGATVFGIGWLAKEASIGIAVAYAGKTTHANVVMQLMQDLNFSISLAWAVGAGGVIYGKRERTLRKQTTERLSHRLKKYEEELDPDRTSSSLTPQGDTNPKDKS